MSSDSTATVTFVVTGLERVSGAGRLVALATVEIDLEGVVVVVQGVQVIRDRGRISTQAPRFRNPRTGVWMPAVILPQELGLAIAEELHQTLMRRPGGIALPDLLATLSRRGSTTRSLPTERGARCNELVMVRRRPCLVRPTTASRARDLPAESRYRW